MVLKDSDYNTISGNIANNNTVGIYLRENYYTPSHYLRFRLLTI
ncbi:MAG: hypothetical protein ACFFBZ_13320 [Promethearchaeota archaeon]